MSQESGRITLYSRDGTNLIERFPLIVEALTNLRLRSCIMDGEAVACGRQQESHLFAGLALSFCKVARFH
jgi:ATP-dependent DNA ligase